MNDLEPVYSDFKNTLQEKKLYGKVKKIEYHKTTFQNNGLEDKSVLNKIEEYTDFGKLEKAEYYDNFGNLLQVNVVEYNENKDYIKSTARNESNKSNILQTVQYDSIKNTSLLSVYVNDTLYHKTISFFSQKGFPIKTVSIKENDTTELNYEYEFNENNKLLFAKQTEKNNIKPITSNLNEYDQIDNLIKSTYKTEWVEMISEMKWKNGRLLKQTNYTISADSIKRITNITEFDILYNTSNSKEFENSKLNRELRFEYEFDEKGNWINKKVSMKEDFNNSTEFIPVYVNMRKINYWK